MTSSTFHDTVHSLRPKNQKTKPTTYWVAVLKSNFEPSENHKEDDFLWIKCHGGINVKTIHDQYLAKHPDRGEVFLKLGTKVPGELHSMRDLDEFADHLLAFEAVETSHLPIGMVADRVPLQPSNHQLSGVMADSAELGSKTKSPTFSPGKARGHPAQSPAFDENATPQNENIIPQGGFRSPSISSDQSSLAIAAQATSYRTPYQMPALTPRNTSLGPKTPVGTNDTVPTRVVKDETTPAILNRFIAPAHSDWATTTGFDTFADIKREKYNMRKPQLDESQIRHCIHKEWLQLTASERQIFEESSKRNSSTPSVKFEPIKANLDLKDVLPVEPNDISYGPGSHRKQDFQLQALLKEATPEQLETSVTQGVKLLDQLKVPMLDQATTSSDAAQWVQQIDNLRKQAVKTKTIIGVVGNTGAGKSSVINALLDEERIIPTNCMRACTAVVTEISYNDTEIPYHAQIEFIQVVDWEKELKTLFQDLLDPNGNVSRDAGNPDSDAGIAYAKIKAVYPRKTRDDIAESSIEKLVKDVAHILGTERQIKETDSMKFYRKLQHYVDSKEKSTGDKEKDKKKERKELEFWPLIRVVRIHVKSPALATGAVIVDLPGVHDSNAARAAVAENYMKQCTGLWIVAPINRAVDDKAAKSLLGESFKRQLKMDGGFSTITFVCSKTDDISLMEAQESLGLDDEMGESWLKIDELSKKQKSLERDIKEMRETNEILGEKFNNSDEQIEVWESLKESLEDGKTVYPPGSKKRKRNRNPKARKKQRRDSDSDGGFIDDEDSERSASESDTGKYSDCADLGEPLTEEQISAKIEEFRSMKKEARRQRSQISEKIKELLKEKAEAQAAEKTIEAEMSALCISGRNEYSKGAIQQDFAQGIRELDQELAAEEDEENFDPEADSRDYEEVARSLPVFCVSSRGYQKLQGRLRKDPTVPGFKTLKETEIPQLQAHCKLLTEAGRSANCKRFINSLSQLLNSLSLWASNDGTSANMTAEQRRREEKYLHKGLKELERGLDQVVVDTCAEIEEAFKENIFEKYEPAIANATEEATKTALKWGTKVNRDDRAAGGYCWATYKAICRRNGEYSNAQGPHQWNYELIEPMMKMIASGWERTFSRRIPAILSSFIRNAANTLRQFHREVSSRALKVGAGLAGLHMLQQQLGVYESILKDLTGIVKDVINTSQKDINREFTPVVARAMIPAYEGCTNENGPGSYARMKSIMYSHVDNERGVMFQESAEEAQERLEVLVKRAQEIMCERVDEVFRAMRRDYRSVLGGGEDTQGELLPKAQRLMRKEVMKVLEDIEGMFKDVLEGKREDIDQDHTGSSQAEAVKAEERDFEDDFDDAARSDRLQDSWIDEATNLTNESEPNDLAVQTASTTEDATKQADKPSPAVSRSNSPNIEPQNLEKESHGNEEGDGTMGAVDSPICARTPQDSDEKSRWNARCSTEEG